MPQFMSVEVSGEMIADLMADDGNFAAEVYRTLAERVQMGAMRDDAADICAGMTAEDASFLANSFADLAQAMRDGYNMSHHDKQI